MTQVDSIPSYVSAFDFNISDLNVNMAVTPFTIGGKTYETVRYKGVYNVALVRFVLKFHEKSIRIYVPFYQSLGNNSSTVGMGTWFPFHCASQKLEQTRRDYYYRSRYGTSYLFKIGHYFPEPFNDRFEEIGSQVGLREIIPAAPNSTFVRQRNFLIQQTSEVPIDLLYPEVDKGVGVHTILERFGNLLYLIASYFLFGDTSGWNPSTYPDGSQERAFASVLNRIGSQTVLGNKSWRDIVSQLPRTKFDPRNYFPANTSNALNFVLADNSVTMPHYQDVFLTDNSPDAKFLTYMKLLQIVGELYLGPDSISLWQQFDFNFDKIIPINEISLTDQSTLSIKNYYYVWLVPEIFSGKNTLVRLYRFV